MARCQGGFGGGGFLGRVDPFFRCLHPFVRQVIRLFIPKSGRVDQPGEITGNNKSFVDLAHDLGQQLDLRRECGFILIRSLPCAGIIAFRHVPAGGLVAHALSGADQAPLHFQELGGVRSRAFRLHGFDTVPHIHFLDHAGGQALALVGHPIPAGHHAAAAKSARRGCPLNEHGQAGRDPLLDGNGGDKFVCVPYPRNGGGQVRNLTQLAGAVLGPVRDHMLGLDVHRGGQLPALHIVLLDEIAHRPAGRVVLDPTHHGVALVPGDGGGGVQFVHLDHLELERHQAAPRVSLDEQDPAVHLLPRYGHAHDLGERLGRGYVAVFLAAPLLPQLVQLVV